MATLEWWEFAFRYDRLGETTGWERVSMPPRRINEQEPQPKATVLRIPPQLAASGQLRVEYFDVSLEKPQGEELDALESTAEELADAEFMKLHSGAHLID
jgi:hypothetical protein